VLRRLAEGSAWEWLKAAWAQHPWTVAGLVGDEFPAYCKIFHPCVELLLEPAVLAGYARAASQGDRQDYDGIWLARRRLLGGETDVSIPYRRLRIRDLAARFHRPFGADFSVFSIADQLPLNIALPEEGVLPKQIAARLIQILRAIRDNWDCFFMWTLTPPNLGDDVPGVANVYRGDIDDLLAYMSQLTPEGGKTLPEFWWPDDRAWAVCTNTDLTFSVMGGSQQLIARVLADPEIEAIRVRSETRVDERASDFGGA